MTHPNDAAVLAARAALVAYGASVLAFAESVCRCDDAECLYRSPETYPLHVLLQDVARATRDHISAPPHEAGAERELRAALISFGEHFHLFRCPCGEPDCPATTAPTAPLGDLVYTAYVQWYGLSGCLGREGAEQSHHAAEIAIRNLHGVRAWTAALSAVPRVFIETAIAAYATQRSAAWLREAQILAVECTERWIPRLVQLPEVEDAMDLVLLIAESGAWTDAQAQDWLILANDALLSLMTRDLLDPAATQVMYAGIEPLVPLRAVRAAVVAGDTGAPRGFFAFAA